LAKRITPPLTKSPQIGLYDGKREQCVMLYTAELSFELPRLGQAPPGFVSNPLDNRSEALRRNTGLHLRQAQPCGGQACQRDEDPALGPQRRQFDKQSGEAIGSACGYGDGMCCLVLAPENAQRQLEERALGLREMRC